MATKRPARVIINIAPAQEGEDQRVYVGGAPEGDFDLMRGVDIAVPQSVVERLSDAVAPVPSGAIDPVTNRPITVLRARFPFRVIGPAE